MLTNKLTIACFTLSFLFCSESMTTQLLGKKTWYAIQWYQVQVTEVKYNNQIVSSLVTINYKPALWPTLLEHIPVSQAATISNHILLNVTKKMEKQNNIRPSQILLEHNFEVSNSVQHINNGRSFVPFLTQLPICHQLNSYITKANKSSGLKFALKCLRGDDLNNLKEEGLDL